jgi:serine/threonine protein kinase
MQEPSVQNKNTQTTTGNIFFNFTSYAFFFRDTILNKGALLSCDTLFFSLFRMSSRPKSAAAATSAAAFAASIATTPTRPLRHRKNSLLSQGSFGRVYCDTTDETSVYKQSLLFPPLASQRQLDEIECNNVDDALSASDLRELVFYSQWTHPNMARLHGAAFAGTRPHMDLKLARGGTTLDDLARAPLRKWKTWMQQGHLRDVVRQAALLLVALTKRDVVHGDLKPLNMLYDSTTRQLCVIDWGAYILRPHIRDPHELECTFVFESPESLHGHMLTPPGAFDVWSLGMSLMVMLLGREPDLGVDLDGDEVREELAQVYKAHEKAGRKHLVFSEHAKQRQQQQQQQQATAGLPYLSPARKAAIVAAVPHYEQLLALLKDMLTLDPQQRITAAQVLLHPWVTAPEQSVAAAAAAAVAVAADSTVHAVPTIVSIDELQPTAALTQQVALCPTTKHHMMESLERHSLTWTQRATAIDQLLIWSTFDTTQKALVAGIHIWDRYMAAPSSPTLGGDVQRYLWFGQLCQVLAIGVLLNYQTNSLAMLRERFPRLQRRTHLDLALVLEHLQGCLMLPSAHHDYEAIDSVHMRQARPSLTRRDEDNSYNWSDIVSFARLAQLVQHESYYPGGTLVTHSFPPFTPSNAPKEGEEEKEDLLVAPLSQVIAASVEEAKHD